MSLVSSPSRTEPLVKTVDLPVRPGHVKRDPAPHLRPRWLPREAPVQRSVLVGGLLEIGLQRVGRLVRMV